MSIQSEINRIEQNIANAYSTLSARGATLPAEQNSENLASAISEIGGADWNQNDPTQPDYIENRTHFCSDPIEATFSGPYTWKEGSRLYEKGMSGSAIVGTIFTDVPINVCDFSGIFGASYTNVLMGQVTSSKSGPSFKFCWYANYVDTGYEIELHSNTTAGMYGATPTMNNFRAVTKLPEAYLPDAVNDHVADKNNPHELTARKIGAIPNYGDGDYFLNGHLSFESSASDLLFSSDGIRAVVYEQEGLETSDSRPIITVATYDRDGSNANPFTTIAPGITHVGYDEYSDNTDIRAGRIEFYDQEGTIKIGITGDAQDIYDPDADSYVIGFADGDDNPIILRGVNWPTQPNDAANKEYVDGQINSKIIIETTVVEGGPSSYPDGTIIFTKE